jgi:RimJ/RimL family protein N-acetyltransferase
MHLVIDDPKRVGRWVAPRSYATAGYGKPGEQFQAVGVENNKGELAGGMVFTDYLKHKVTIHLAIDEPRFVRRSFYQYCFQYAFIWMGVDRVHATCINGYKRNERLLNGMFFKKEGVVRRGWQLPDGTIVDAAIYGCLREECELLPEEYRYAGPII